MSVEEEQALRELPGNLPADPFPERELSISVPPPPAGSGPATSLYRSQLDAPMRVKISLPVALAILFHAGIFALAFLLPRLLGGPPPLRKPIIARIIVQGRPRDQKLMPRREPAASAPPPSPGMVLPQKAPTKAEPSVKARPSEPRAKQPSREELMERALAQATRGVEQEEHRIKPEEREGALDGSPEGNSSDAEEGDQYFAAVQAAILANYVLPSIISERERMSLKAIVDAWIARDGTIVKHTFEKRSGNRFFDDALELAIKNTKVPPPPPDRAAAIARDGVALVFTP